MADKGIEITLATEVDTASVFAEHAASRPGAHAILAPGRAPLNFAGLHAQQLYVCEALAGCGINRGDPVAVLLPKGPEMAVACAVLPASATVVPLDPNLSTEEYETLFRRCSARALITPGNLDHGACLAADRAGIFQLELLANPDAPAGTFELHIATEPKEHVGRIQCDANAAYILTTSGTTAQRKLVPIQHRNIVAYAKAMENWLRFEPTDLSLHLSPMYFGHGIKSALMVPLLSGTSVLCPPAFEIDAFFRLFDE